MSRRLAIVLITMLAGASRDVDAARLEYAGDALSRRAAEALMAPALRAPRDSNVLEGALGAVVARLQNQGYLDARANGEWRPDGALALGVEPGTRYKLAAWTVHAASREDSARTARMLPLVVGAPASPEAIARALETAVAGLVNAGHAYAELSVRTWEADSGRLRVGISAIPGPQVLIEQVRIDGLVATREDVARRALRGLEDRPYDPAAAAAARDRLLRLKLFRDVRFDGLVSIGDWSRGRLVYAVEEPRYNAFEGAVGAQGDGVVVGRARVELGNLLGTGRNMGLRWQSTGSDRSELAVRYREPMLLQALLAADLLLEQEIRDSTYTRTRWGGALDWMATQHEMLSAGFDVERVVQGSGSVSESRLENVRFAAERAVWDDAAAPRRGYRLRASAAQVFKRERLRPEGSRTTRANTVEAWIEGLRPLRRTTGLSLELSGAGRFSSDPVLGVYERWPLGGAATLRGFDEDQFRVDRYALSRFEWRAGAARQQAYLFWDHAWTWTRTARLESGDVEETLHLDGIGVGLRLETRAGRIGLAYGLEFGRPALEGKVHAQLISTF